MTQHEPVQAYSNKTDQNKVNIQAKFSCINVSLTGKL